MSHCIEKSWDFIKGFTRNKFDQKVFKIWEKELHHEKLHKIFYRRSILISATGFSSFSKDSVWHIKLIENVYNFSMKGKPPFLKEPGSKCMFQHYFVSCWSIRCIFLGVFVFLKVFMSWSLYGVGVQAGFEAAYLHFDLGGGNIIPPPERFENQSLPTT